MRKLVYGINLTIDGCCDHTKVNAGEEIHYYFANLLQQADTIVYGRKTYELMVPFWPEMAKTHSGPTQSLNDFADAFDSVSNIVVFSKTLEQPEGKKTRVVRTGLKEEILKLKQQPGKDISLGGVDLPSQLMELGLIDEYRFVIHPIIAGEGRRLLDGNGLAERLQLKLVDTEVLPSSGCVVLKYAKM